LPFPKDSLWWKRKRRDMAPDPLAAIRDAARRVDAAEGDLRAARAAFRDAIIDARQAGVTLEKIGKELGVTRQRVAQILEGRGGA
jgi:predicted transcriptional regulator